MNKRTFRLLKEIPGLDKKVGELLTIEAEKISHRELSTVEYDPATRPDLWEEVKEDFKTKKYKLVKTYPGSPELGTIVDKRGVIVYFPQDTPTVYHSIAQNQVENYPEFWQKVEEKKVLFTCEDGISIKEGDEYWFIVLNKENYPALRDREWKPIREIAKDSNPQFKHEELQKHLGNKTFSTKEKAEEFIYFAKPRFSFKDIEKAYVAYVKFHGMNPSLKDIIRNLKEKLIIDDTK